MNEIAIQKSLEAVGNIVTRENQEANIVDGSFSGILKHAIDEVNQAQIEADKSIRELAAGGEKDIHQTMIAMEKAEVSFQLMMQVRNKIVEAYEQIMRMQV